MKNTIENRIITIVKKIKIKKGKIKVNRNNVKICSKYYNCILFHRDFSRIMSYT